MQAGASKSGSELLKSISRDKTPRLSAAALLDFFRPLETWLEQQNRMEPVIGWNSNLEDVGLFKMVHSSARSIKSGTFVNFLMFLAVLIAI